MSIDRIESELNLLRGWFGSEFEYLADGHWVRLPTYNVPSELWAPQIVAVAFQIPAGIPAEQPYGFYVHPVLSVQGATIGNYDYPVATPFGTDWGKFSWSPVEWRPHDQIRDGSNMVEFVRSFADRFREGP